MIPNRKGHTLARGREDRRAVEALRDPHPGDARWDPAFRTAFKCNRCGKFAYGPRALMREALQEHWQSDCSARHTKADTVMQAQILYPKQ